MEWMVSFNKLSSEQREFFQTVFDIRRITDDCYWIQGPAGSGKTVDLVHTIITVFSINPEIKACVVLYTYALIDLVKTGIPDELKGKIQVMTYFEFARQTETYDAIFVDEVQDLPIDVLRLIRTRASKIVVAGDTSQSIYKQGCQPDLIAQTLRAKIYTLQTIHRLTNKIISIASIFHDTPQLLQAAPRGRLQNVEVIKYQADTCINEIYYLLNKAKEFASAGYSTAILIPKHSEITNFFDIVCNLYNITPWDWQTNNNNYNDWGSKRREYTEFNNFIQSKGQNIQYLGNGFGSLEKSEEKHLINVMTYHSSKGLDFEVVFIPLLSSTLEIWRDDDKLERTLFFVALTRSRMNLFLSYHGYPHKLLTQIPEHLFKVESKNTGTFEQPDREAVYEDSDDLPF